jgi:DNA-binding protein HU-beta
MSRRHHATDVRSDYDFLDGPRPRYHRGDAATVTVDGRTVDLNDVPNAFTQSRPARALTKAGMVDRVAERTGLSKKDARIALDAVIASIEDSLRDGEEISFTGFGKFHVAKRSARKARNPSTGKTMRIAARRVPRFTAGSALKRLVG